MCRFGENELGFVIYGVDNVTTFICVSCSWKLELSVAATKTLQRAAHPICQAGSNERKASHFLTTSLPQVAVWAASICTGVRFPTGLTSRPSLNMSTCRPIKRNRCIQPVHCDNCENLFPHFYWSKKVTVTGQIGSLTWGASIHWRTCAERYLIHAFSSLLTACNDARGHACTWV